MANGWVAFHSNPKGIIQFVGSFFIFGYLPTLFYNSLLRNLFNKRYTIIIYPISLIPPLNCELKRIDHLKASIYLLKTEYLLKQELIEYLTNWFPNDYIDLYLNHSSYFWLGHSLGCKYISILEFLSNEINDLNNILELCNLSNHEKKIITDEINFIESYRKLIDTNIEKLLERKRIQGYSNNKLIKDQASIFLAPELYGTPGNNFLPNLPGLKLFPDGDTTICLIKNTSNLFNLTGLISFVNDNISEDDVLRIISALDNRPHFTYKPLDGSNTGIEFLDSLLSHLKPIDNNIQELSSYIDKMFDSLSSKLQS